MHNIYTVYVEWLRTRHSLEEGRFGFLVLLQDFSVFYLAFYRFVLWSYNSVCIRVTLAVHSSSKEPMDTPCKVWLASALVAHAPICLVSTLASATTWTGSINKSKQTANSCNCDRLPKLYETDIVNVILIRRKDAFWVLVTRLAGSCENKNLFYEIVFMLQSVRSHVYGATKQDILLYNSSYYILNKTQRIALWCTHIYVYAPFEGHI